jgi:diguanylate cyclase (GGDEF)-like protein
MNMKRLSKTKPARRSLTPFEILGLLGGATVAGCCLYRLLLFKLHALLEHERALSRTDYLTGTANVRAFYEVAQQEIERARRYHHPFTVAYLDVDNFKSVNDQFGHRTGDRLLRVVAQAIQNDLRPTDTMARLGGDEFALLLPEANCEAAAVVLRRVQERVLREMQKHRWPVTLSVGALTCLNPPRRVDELIGLTDDLMYQVKDNGKNDIRHECH